MQAFNLNVVKALNEINHLRPEPAPCPSAEFKSKTASWKTERAKWTTISTLPATNICMPQCKQKTVLSEREEFQTCMTFFFFNRMQKEMFSLNHLSHLVHIFFFFMKRKNICLTAFVFHWRKSNKFTTLGLSKQWQLWPLTNLYNFKLYI